MSKQKEELKTPQVKWYEYLVKKVPDDEYVPWYYAVALFFILFIILFIAFSISEMQNYNDSYDKTSYTVDMFGRRKYKTIKGTEPDFFIAEELALKVSIFIAILTYVTNYMYYLRKVILISLKKVFSLF